MAFFIYAEYANPDVVKHIISSQDFNINHTDNDGRSALWWACAQYRGPVEILKMLGEAAINANQNDINVNHIDKYGNNIMEMYLNRNEPIDFDVVKLLLKLGFDQKLLCSKDLEKIRA